MEHIFNIVGEIFNFPLVIFSCQKFIWYATENIFILSDFFQDFYLSLVSCSLDRVGLGVVFGIYTIQYFLSFLGLYHGVCYSGKFSAIVTSNIYFTPSYFLVLSDIPIMDTLCWYFEITSQSLDIPFNFVLFCFVLCFHYFLFVFQFFKFLLTYLQDHWFWNGFV